MKKLFFSIFALLCALSMNAQEVCGYTAKSEQGTYADLVGGTIVNTAAADTTKAYDGMCYALDGEGKTLAQKEMTDVAGFPIGFTFNYLGKAFTQFGICANGYVILGTADQKLSFKAASNWYGYNGMPYAIGLYSNTRFTRVGADQMQISYKSSATELVVEFKNVLLSSASKLTSADALDPANATLWGYQLHILSDGNFYWIVKGLAEDTKGGSTSMALTENVNEYVGFTNYSKQDFLTNPVADAMSCSTASTIKAAPEGTKVVFIAAPEVVAPTLGPVSVKIDDKKSSGEGLYTFRATIVEPEEGDAEGYMMLLSKDAEPDTNPVNGVAYADGDVLGNSKVYSSSGTVHNLYNLEAGVYYAKAFAYNKIGKNGPKYLIEGAPMSSVATPKAGTTAPDSIWVRTTAATSIGLGVKGNAAGQTIIVAMCDSTYNPGNYGVRPYPGNLSAASMKNDPILDENGNQVGKVVYVGVPNATNGSTFTASGLQASTPYYFVAYASDGEQLSWDPDFVQVWASTKITVPYSVAMSKAPENNQPVGWTSEPGGEFEGFYVTQANVGGDALHPSGIPVLMGLNTRFKANDYTASLTSPLVTLTKDCKYTFKWRMDENGMYGMAGAGHGPENWEEEGEYLRFEVICDGDTTLAKNYTWENAPYCLANKEWVNDDVDLSAYAGKDVQVKMTWRCPFTKGVKMYLDSLTFEQYSIIPAEAPSLYFVKRHGNSSFELKANVVEVYEGASDGYLMLISKNAAPDTTPVDGVTYEDGTTLGNASVAILSGRLLTENIQKPEEGATYYVTAYAYNNGKGGPKYLIEGAPLASVVIPTADLDCPAEFRVLNEMEYADKLSFSVTANEANQKIIVVYNDSTCNPGNYGATTAVGEIDAATAKAGDQLYDPAGNPCGKIAYVGGTGEFTVEGLLPSMSYYFTAYSANDKAVSWGPDYLNIWTATKGIAPYEVNMAAAPAGELPGGWSCTPMGENKGFYKQRNGLTKNLPPSGNPDVFYASNPTLDEETLVATLLSPMITLTKNNVLSFDWLTVAWGRFSNTAYGPSAWAEEDYLKVELLDGVNAYELKNYDFENAPACLDTQEYVSESIDLSAYEGKDVWIRLSWHCTQGSQIYFYMDAFKIEASETPTGIEEVKENNISRSEGMYNLRGQKITKANKGDIIIVNGNKYIAQ